MLIKRLYRLISLPLPQLSVAFDCWGGMPGGESLPGGEVTLGRFDSEGEMGDELVEDKSHFQRLFFSNQSLLSPPSPRSGEVRFPGVTRLFAMFRFFGIWTSSDAA